LTMQLLDRKVPLSMREIGPWRPVQPASPEERILITFALRLRNAEVLEEIVSRVSDPKHVDYGKYWSMEQIADLVAPPENQVNTVMEWLKQEGVSDLELVGTRDSIRAIVPVSLAEKLLSVSFFSFKHMNKNVTITRTLDPCRIPSFVAQYVQLVAGIHSFPLDFTPIREPNAAPQITPQILYSLYGINQKASTTTKTSQGLAEFQLQDYSPSDLTLFQQKFNLAVQKLRNVKQKNDNAHIEANLDVQYIMAMGQNVPTDFYLVDGFAFDLFAWINAVEQPSSPFSDVKVWSVSYGEGLSAVTIDYATRLDAEFQKVALNGTTIIFASGDSGVYSRGMSQTTFQPSFPACLPHVTAVGATQLTGGKELQSTSWSGGGFSLQNYFPRESTASYQVNAVNNYFSSGVSLPPQEKWNRPGRGFPDVSAQGVGFAVVESGTVIAVSGTSASAPTFGGIVSLLNDIRLANNKPTLGFLNPFIYTNADSFNDITQGFNSDGTPYGFHATKGWDPVTGVGTPNFAKLKVAVLQ